MKILYQKDDTFYERYASSIQKKVAVYGSFHKSDLIT